MATWQPSEQAAGLGFVDWAKSCRVFGDVALVVPSQSTDAAYMFAAVAVRWTASGPTVGTLWQDKVGPGGSSPTASCRLTDGLAVATYRPEYDDTVGLRVFSVDQSTLDVTLAGTWTSPDPSWSGSGSQVVRVSDSRFLVTGASGYLALFEYAAGVVTLLDDIALTATGTLTYASGYAYSQVDNIIEQVAVGDTLTLAGSWATVSAPVSQWGTDQGHGLAVGDTIHWLGTVDTDTVGYHLTIPIGEAGTAESLGYDVYTWNDLRFHDDISLDADGTVVYGMVQDLTGYDVHLLTLTSGGDETVLGLSGMFQHEITALGSGHLLITSIDNDGGLWVTIGTVAAAAPIPPRRLTQRDDGLFWGAPRLTGSRSRQASNRLLGGYL